jgi:hypothetical protein
LEPHGTNAVFAESNLRHRVGSYQSTGSLLTKVGGADFPVTGTFQPATNTFKVFLGSAAPTNNPSFVSVSASPVRGATPLTSSVVSPNGQLAGGLNQEYKLVSFDLTGTNPFVEVGLVSGSYSASNVSGSITTSPVEYNVDFWIVSKYRKAGGNR